jgi:hypothetical protein
MCLGQGRTQRSYAFWLALTFSSPQIDSYKNGKEDHYAQLNSLKIDRECGNHKPYNAHGGLTVQLIIQRCVADVFCRKRDQLTELHQHTTRYNGHLYVTSQYLCRRKWSKVQVCTSNLASQMVFFFLRYTSSQMVEHMSCALLLVGGV